MAAPAPPIALLVALILVPAALALPPARAGERLEHVAHAADVPTGAGIWIRAPYLYVAGLDTGLHVVDLSDPAHPVRVGHLGGLHARDVAAVEYPDGSFVLVASANGDGLHVIGAADPTSPRLITTREYGLAQWIHNVAVLPGTRLVYPANGFGGGTPNMILDLSDPAEPLVVATYGQQGCHDITFHQGPGKSRLYCAGVGATEIWDLADPLRPRFVTRIANPLISAAGTIATGQVLGSVLREVDEELTPLGGFTELGPGLHHWALPTRDARLLIIGDEFLGGAAGGCTVSVDADGRTVSGPLGAIWFYDISDERRPRLVSWFSPPLPADNVLHHATAHPQAAVEGLVEHLDSPDGLSCTAHFGDLVANEPRVAVGWNAAGTVVVDFSDAANPRLLDAWSQDTDTWEVRHHAGHLVTGDVHRGADLLRLIPALLPRE